MDIDIDIQTAEGGITGQGAQTPICRVSRSGSFLLIPMHETKVGRVFYMLNCYLSFSF